MKQLGKKKETQQELRAAIYKATRHLEEHYDEPSTTAELAKIAGLSTFHFHRAFRAVVGETVAQYSLRVRVERSAALLKFSSWQISEIGLACGFQTSASFARGFKRLYGMSPGSFRETSGTVPYLRAYMRSKPGEELERTHTQTHSVVLEDWEPIRVICLRYTGSTNGIYKPWDELLGWAKQHLQHMDRARYFGLWFDYWSDLKDEHYRYECAILPSEPVQDLPKPFHWRTIPAGQLATAKTEGTLTEIDNAWRSFASGWLPFSGFQPRGDFAFDEYPAQLILASRPKQILSGLFGNISIRMCLPVQKEPIIL